ncbi:amino acid ABC transporter permease [Azonexus sp. IMCC34839]|uniref:amino acid ABC transporter permease n=1 Tax=Azonexus sp. IMCC34839 TaxID=3133695 RepID=UPI003999EEF2
MSYQWNWGIFLQPSATGDDTYLGWMIAGFKMTIGLSLSAWALALLLGALVGVLRTVPNKVLAGLATAYVELFRNVPLLVQLFIWYFVLPELLPPSIGDAYKQSNPILQQFLASMVCLGLFTSARVAEQVRAGINSLPKGQKNAGLALGFTLPQTYRHVMLPMAFRLIVPPLTSEFLNIFKNSAVCSTIGLLELAAQGRQLVDYTAQPYESFIAVTIAYISINVVVMFLMKKFEDKVRVPGYMGGK